MKTPTAIIISIALIISSYFIGDGLKGQGSRLASIPDRISLDISQSNPIQISLQNGPLIPSSIELNFKSPGEGGGIHVIERKK